MRLIDANELKRLIKSGDDLIFDAATERELIYMIDYQPTIEAEPVRHGHWIECDYQHLAHGEVETDPRAGWCCSICHVGFSKKKMTYKQYCPHCGAKMDGGSEDDER